MSHQKYLLFFQEQSSTTSTGTINPDWSSFQVFNFKSLLVAYQVLIMDFDSLSSLILQAYSPIPPHGFLASSPQAHPYMWGVQVIVAYVINAHYHAAHIVYNIVSQPYKIVY